MEEQVTMPVMAEPVADKASGALAGVKKSLQAATDFVTEKLHEYKGTLTEVGIYFAIGFVAGFLLKKYMKYILLIIVGIALLVVLDQFDLVHTYINWDKVQEVLKLQSAGYPLDTQTTHAYLAWIKANLIIVLSGVAGFLIGLKVG